MTTPSQIAELVRRTAPDADIDEAPGHLVLRAELADAQIRASWLALRDQNPPYIAKIAISEADSDGQLEAGIVPAAGERFRITIESTQVAGELRLYLARSLSACEEQVAASDVILLAEMASQETFATYCSRFQVWTSDPVAPFAPSEPLPDPRNHSSDFTGGREVPSDIRPWLIRSKPESEGAAFEIWRGVSARRLIASLSDRVSKESSDLTYHFNGPPTCRLSPKNDELTGMFWRLQDAASWVFTETRDADTRHLLLAAEWARSSRSGGGQQAGDGSLDSAKAAFAAYVKSRSKDTLKALADLRKAVIDESQKAAQRAQDLAGAMWKDLAVAAVPFVLKILPDASKAASQTLAGVLAICAAIFVAFSFGVQVYINKRYFRHQKAAREVWKRALNAALSTSEVDEFSEEPIRNSIQDYRNVRLAVGIVYAALVAALLYFAGTNLFTSAAPEQAKPVTSSAAASTAPKQPTAVPPVDPVKPPKVNPPQIGSTSPAPAPALPPPAVPKPDQATSPKK